MVPQLGLIEKGYKPEEYEVKELDLRMSQALSLKCTLTQDVTDTPYSRR